MKAALYDLKARAWYLIGGVLFLIHYVSIRLAATAALRSARSRYYGEFEDEGRHCRNAEWTLRGQRCAVDGALIRTHESYCGPLIETACPPGCGCGFIHAEGCGFYSLRDDWFTELSFDLGDGIAAGSYTDSDHLAR